MGRTAARRTPDDLLRGSPAAGQPRALTAWPERPASARVEHGPTWVIRSLPVPTGAAVQCPAAPGGVRRCRALGYGGGGGGAVARIWEEGRLVEARLALGGRVPEGEATTGELTWVAGGRRLPLAQVGPVAYSEGMRMAAAVH